MSGPTVLDHRFELEREVGGGGMGRIWRARDREGERPVAIKLIAGDDPAAAERFRREAALLAAIRHPGIVDYVAHGTVDGQPYLAMEWLDGVDLAVRMRGVRVDAHATVPATPFAGDAAAVGAGAATATGELPAVGGATAAPAATVGLPVAEVVVMARRLASALGEVHARGVVHRDLKPDNIFLLDGDLTRAKLIDFGVARDLQPSAALTEAGLVIGTPYYMAPEQVRGEDVGPSADVWGLGCVLYEALAGRPPFSASHPLAAMARIIVDEPAALAGLRPDVPAALAELVHAMLAKPPAARPRSGEPLAQAFERLVAELGAPATAPAWTPATTPVPGRHRLTGGERRIRSLLFARRAEAERGGARSLERLRARVAALGGELEAMDARERVFLVTAGGAASPRDQATRAATIALALAQVEDGLAIAVVTGRGSEDGRRTPVGEVVDRAVELLAGVAAGAIELDALSAGLVEGRCEVEGDGGRFRLRGLRLAEDARTLLGRPSRWVGRRRELTTLLASFDDCLEHHAARAVLVIGDPGMGKSRLRHELLRVLASRGEPVLVLHGHGDSVAAGTPFGVLAPAVRGELMGRGGDGVGNGVGGGVGDGGGVGVGNGGGGGNGGGLGGGVGNGVGLGGGVGNGVGVGNGGGLGLGLGLGPGVGTGVGTGPGTGPGVGNGLGDGGGDGAGAARLVARLARVGDAATAGRLAPFLGELCGVRFADDAHPALAAARGDPMLLGEQVRAAFAAWLAAEARRRPVVLVIEDLHWGDLPSVNAIDHALRELAELPLLVLATARAEVRDVFPRLWAGRGVVEIELHPLPARACAELVSDALGAGATAEVVEQLVARCEGNAFFLEELIRAVAAGGLTQLPDTVIGTVQARLTALDQEARRVLRAAAVFGEVFREDGVAALLGGTGGAFAVGEWLDDLERRELIHAAGGGAAGARRYRFRHALVRDGAYQMLTDDDRLVGHFLAGRWLEQVGERDALTLAGHAERGGDLAAAARWYRAAVEDALEGNDLAAVRERGERAIAAGASGPVRGEIRGAQAVAAYWQSDYAGALDLADDALAHLPIGSAPWFRAAGAATVAAARLGDFDGVARRFDPAVAAPCAPGAVAAQLQCLCRGAFQLVFNGRFVRADEILARIAELRRAAPALDALTRAQVEHVQGVRAAHVGDVARFFRHLQAAVAAFEEAGDGRNVSLERTTIAWCHAELGELAEAERLARENLAHCQRLRAPQAVTYARVNLGFILAHGGARAEAVAVLGEAIAECAAVGNARLGGWARAHRATAHLFDGEAARALADAEAAIAALATAPGLGAWAQAVAARALVALGRAGDALPLARAAVAVLDELGGLLQGESVPPLALAEALSACGDPAAAAAWADARARLEARAARLGDDGWRATFLALPENRVTLAGGAA